MSSVVRKVSLVFAAGCVGGLVNGLLIWYLGQIGVPQKFGVAIAPALAPPFLYAKLVWGGIWGALFLLPLWRSGFWTGVVIRGILFSFGPTLAQLLYVFPQMAHKGMFGTDLGGLTPLFVVFYNGAWGIAAALWLHAANKGS